MTEFILSKVGEFALSKLFESLYDRLAVPNIRHWIRGEGDQGLEAHLDEWRQKLQDIQKTHDDAEEKQYSDTAVKQWLDDLKHLVYDVDDIVDELATKASTAAENQARPRKLRKLNIGGASSSTHNIDSTLLSKITELTERFNRIVIQKDELNLKETADGRSHGKTEVRTTTCLLTEPEHHIYGRDKDKKAILELLMGEKYCSDAPPFVIPILGMGGIGKTTLAQLVYNDEAVQKSFDLKAWACISQDFDVERVTKTILQLLISENCDGKDLNWLQVKLKEKLQGKKFLVVLDDLWSDDDNDWRTLRAPFLAGAPGSKIVITTRIETVPSCIERVPSKASIIQPYRLEVLSNDDCFSVFTQNALGASNFNEHPDLQDIGEKFVEKCKGLPLVARTLGCLLRTKKKERNEWKAVLKSKIWDIPKARRGIFPALMLSYHHLPSHLKRCIMYCSILPEDYEFEEQELILLWMAEGLIQPPKGDMQMEDLGSEYFQDLLSRSFFQQSSTKKLQFVMHDLIKDLAQRIAGDICFRMEDKIKDDIDNPEKVRHSSYLPGHFDIAKKFEPFFKFKCLRTFLPLLHLQKNLPLPLSHLQNNLPLSHLQKNLPLLPLPLSHLQKNLPLPLSHLRNRYGIYNYLSHNVSHELFVKLPCLRVLSLSGYYIVELPNSIGDLKHLRYLDLSRTKIRGLPESTTTLNNLQTMILERCSYLKKLPSNLGNLINLRHLNILYATELEGMPPQIGKLTHLRTLSNLIVGKGSCFTLRELGSLLHLRGTLIISQLENVIEPRDASDAKLIEKTDLIALCLEWSNRLDESLDRTSEFEVLNMLQPHKALKELAIRCYGGMEFPTWLRGHSFSHMVLLRIENCNMCTSLPPVGQLPSLKQLFIVGMARVKNVGNEFYGVSCSQPFESLETLDFTNMEEWENWIPNQEFRNLRKLSITNCPKLLGKLPNHFPLLENVSVERCPRLVVSISSLPELCKLQIEGFEGVMRENKVVFNSLNSESISTISKFKSPIEGLILEGLTHVEKLNIENCEELTHLWSNDVGLLQSLPRLRYLRIGYLPEPIFLVHEAEEQPKQGMPSTHNGMEFLPKEIMYNNTCIERIEINGCDSLKHFAIGQLPPTLKRLCIQNCKSMIILLDEDDANSCSTSTSLLEFLEIWKCPSLKFLTSCVELLATLKHLNVKDCGQLESIAKSGELPATLQHLEIRECGQLESMAKSFHHNSSLEKIEIYGCRNLKYMVSIAKSEELPATLQHLTIRNCGQLESIAKSGELPATLQHLEIWDCSKLESIVKSFHHNSSLEKIIIWNCKNLKSLPTGIDTLSHLDTIHIESCPTLVSFPDGGLLPSNLRELKISGNMPLLPNCIHNITSLQKLTIWSASSFPEEGFPANLTSLEIWYCNFTEALPEWGLHRLTSLKHLLIFGGCRNVESFPAEKMLPASLTYLAIGSFPNLKYLSSLRDLASLQQLKIFNCENLTSFQEDGLPLSLQKLTIRSLPNLKYLSSLRDVASLQQLEISMCENLTSFQEDGLPPSLQELSIQSLPNLKNLPSLRNLTSLEKLDIQNCENLTSFPEDGLPPSLPELTIRRFPNLKNLPSLRNLTSLEKLHIQNCENLTSFPEDGFPPSLQQLKIEDCPLLKERCKKDKGQEWPTIAHIPCVKIDNRFIYDSEEEESVKGPPTLSRSVIFRGRC